MQIRISDEWIRMRIRARKHMDPMDPNSEGSATLFFSIAVPCLFAACTLCKRQEDCTTVQQKEFKLISKLEQNPAPKHLQNC